MKNHLPFHSEAYLCPTEDLLNVLLGVAARKTTVESVCTDLLRASDPATVRGYFNEQLRIEELPQREHHLTRSSPPRSPSVS